MTYKLCRTRLSDRKRQFGLAYWLVGQKLAIVEQKIMNKGLRAAA